MILIKISRFINSKKVLIRSAKCLVFYRYSIFKIRFTAAGLVTNSQQVLTSLKDFWDVAVHTCTVCVPIFISEIQFFFCLSNTRPWNSVSIISFRLIGDHSCTHRWSLKFADISQGYIFRNWSRLSLKMYIFMTLEFTTPYFNFHLLTMSVNAKY